MAEIVRMPALSDTMEEGTLVAWHKKVGDSVESGELLAEIETDKAVMEFQSFFDGELLYIGLEEGASIAVDAVIAIIGEPGEDYKSLLEGGDSTNQSSEKENAEVKEKSEEKAPVEATTKEVAEDTEQKEDTTEGGRFKASPLAKAMAKEEGVDLMEVKGSGDDGRIVKRDIEDFLKNGSSKAAAPKQAAPIKVAEPTGDYEDVPLSQMRKVIAKRLGESKFAAPHFYLTMEICMDKMMALRGQVKSLTDTKISYNDFIVKAVAKSLKDHPAINASWLGDRIRYYKYVNIGIAVAVEEGLVVPVVNNADTKALSQIATEIRELAGKAKDRKLSPDQMTGNTFTISNLGMFGIDEFTAIINPPDACILAVGRIAPRLVMGSDGNVKESNFMKVTLSCDHRVVDGAKGAMFLQTLQRTIEEPMRLII